MARCITNRLTSGTFRFCLTQRSQNWLLPGPPNSLETGSMKETASTEAAGCRIDGGQGAKTEILA
jgi:hypothetical protein